MARRSFLNSSKLALYVTLVLGRDVWSLTYPYSLWDPMDCLSRFAGSSISNNLILRAPPNLICTSKSQVDEAVKTAHVSRDQGVECGLRVSEEINHCGWNDVRPHQVFQMRSMMRCWSGSCVVSLRYIVRCVGV